MIVEEEFWVKIGWKERDKVTERKQEVKGVKGARKDAKIGRIRREEREREQEKAFSKKGEYLSAQSNVGRKYNEL